MATFERAARIGGIVALVGALALTLWPRRPADVTTASIEIGSTQYDSAGAVARTIATALVNGSAAGGRADSMAALPALRATVSVIPDADTRAVLAAAVSAGIDVAWIDSSEVRDFAVDASTTPTPVPNTLLSAAIRLKAADTTTSRALSLVLRDDAGTLDSVSAQGSNFVDLRLRTARLRDPVRATAQRDASPRAGTQIGTSTLVRPSPLVVRRVLLIARPGWEAKFAAAALEESGWTVDGTLTISPTARVQLGTPAMADTSRYSAAVVLDSGVADVRALRRFVVQGGGIVVSGDALRDNTLASLLPARIEDDRAPIAGALLTAQPRRGLPAYHLAPTAASAVIEREDDEATVVVARRGVGRVVASGYRATWRWRMEGTDDGALDHRRWWTGLVSTVAYGVDTGSSQADGARSLPGDAAPRADLLARIGLPAATATALAPTARGWRPPIWWLYVIGAGLLLAEWTARRLRGAP